MVKQSFQENRPVAGDFAPVFLDPSYSQRNAVPLMGDWRAWEGKGLPGEPVREMLIEAIEKRFGSVEAVPADHLLEFLSDNGSAYIAADTRAVARSCV